LEELKEENRKLKEEKESLEKRLKTNEELLIYINLRLKYHLEKGTTETTRAIKENLEELENLIQRTYGNKKEQPLRQLYRRFNYQYTQITNQFGEGPEDFENLEEKLEEYCKNIEKGIELNIEEYLEEE